VSIDLRQAAVEVGNAPIPLGNVPIPLGDPVTKFRFTLRRLLEQALVPILAPKLVPKALEAALFLSGEGHRTHRLAPTLSTYTQCRRRIGHRVAAPFTFKARGVLLIQAQLLNDVAFWLMGQVTVLFPAIGVILKCRRHLHLAEYAHGFPTDENGLGCPDVMSGSPCRTPP